MTSGVCDGNSIGRGETMETVQFLSDFVKRTGVPNFLIIGIVIIAIWLIISGLRRGLKKRKTNDGSDDEEGGDQVDTMNK